MPGNRKTLSKWQNKNAITGIHGNPKEIVRDIGYFLLLNLLKHFKYFTTALCY
jgi:hypothetical protein